jgi:hypothetical protein
MNKHILLAMKWLNDNDSVSQKELEKNRGKAYRVADRAATDTCWAAYLAADWSADGEPCYATYSVDEYFKITGEDRNKYEKELNK